MIRVIMMGDEILMGDGSRAGRHLDGGWLMGDEPQFILLRVSSSVRLYARVKTFKKYFLRARRGAHEVTRKKIVRRPAPPH